MALSPEFAQFCRAWRAKAQEYSLDVPRDAFDRFFTLYVIFNRLYGEATFRLAGRGKLKLKDRFPDSKGAQEYVVQFCGAKRLTDAWERNPVTFTAVRQIIDLLVEQRFALKLDMITGQPRPDADRVLLTALGSRSANKRASAGLEVLYAIRCNMFHGRKGFHETQLELLRPAILLLECTIEVLYERLEADIE